MSMIAASAFASIASRAWPADRGGTGGVVPSRVRPAIIEGARRELGVVVTYADFEPQDGEAYLLGAAG